MKKIKIFKIDRKNKRKLLGVKISFSGMEKFIWLKNINEQSKNGILKNVINLGHSESKNDQENEILKIRKNINRKTKKM